MSKFISGHTYRVGNFEVAREVATKVLVGHGYEVSWDKMGDGVAHKGKRFGMLAPREPYIELRLTFPANTPNPSFRLESRADADLGTLCDDLFKAFGEAGLNYSVTSDGSTSRGRGDTSGSGVGRSGVAGAAYDGRAGQGTSGGAPSVTESVDARP